MRIAGSRHLLPLLPPSQQQQPDGPGHTIIVTALSQVAALHAGHRSCHPRREHGASVASAETAGSTPMSARGKGIVLRGAPVAEAGGCVAHDIARALRWITSAATPPLNAEASAFRVSLPGSGH